MRGSAGSPNRSASRIAIGRAPIVKMSRRMPPTPVAAPWYGSTALGWLCDSILNATARPSPIEITPAFSPGPATTPSPPVGSVRSSGRELLYEQCSLHMTLNIASSRSFGSRSEPGRGSRRAPRRSARAGGGAAPRPGSGAATALIGHPRRRPGRAAAARSAALSTSERMIPSPSSEPRTASTAVSGWGIRPATLPAALVTPAIARSDPFGLARSVSSPATVPSGWT